MCKYCEEEEWIPCDDCDDVSIYNDDLLGKSQLSLYKYTCDDGFLINIRIYHCPMCGRKLL